MRRIWFGVLIVIMLLMAGVTLNPVASKNDGPDNSKKLEKLEENLEKKDLSEDQVKEIVNYIGKMKKELTSGEIDDIIEIYMSDEERVYNSTESDSEQKRREMYWRNPSLPTFALNDSSVSLSESTVSPLTYDVQKDSRMYTLEYRYNGVSGYMKPGKLQVSASGTQRHYFTSHIGQEVNSEPHWVEVGVVRDAWNTSYYLFTYDSDNPKGEAYEDHFEIDPFEYHEFRILVLPYNDTHTKYGIWWDHDQLRSGYQTFDDTLQVDEVHEAFAETEGDFEDCDHGYFKKSNLYTPDGGEAWNHRISDDYYNSTPMKADRWLEYDSETSAWYWNFTSWI